MSRTPFVLGLAIVGVLTCAVFFRDQAALGQVEKKDPVKEDVRILTASGSATIRVKPDMARLHLSVETTAATVGDARARSAEQVKKVMDAIQELQIPGLKLKPAEAQVKAQYSDEEKKGKSPRLLGYEVNQSFTVVLTSKDAAILSTNAGRVLDVALERGANNATGIELLKEDLSVAKREVLTKATEDALENARAAAAGAGRYVSDVISINSRFYNSKQRAVAGTNAINGQPSLAETALVAGEIEISAEATVTCTFGAAKN